MHIAEQKRFSVIESNIRFDLFVIL